MIEKFIAVKENVVLLGLVLALAATGALPSLGGHGAEAAKDAARFGRFENTDTPLRFKDGEIASKSTIEVSGFNTPVVDIEVSLRNITFRGNAGSGGSQDMDVLLVGPEGQTALVLSDVGGNTDTVGVYLLLNDDHAQHLPTTPLTTGRFKPTNYDTPDTMHLPGEGLIEPSSNASLGVFNGTDPNGTWTLFAYVDNPNDNVFGNGINAGWGPRITTAEGAPVAEPDRFRAEAGKTLSVPAAGVLENDSDPDDDPLTASLARKPKQGTVTLLADGSFTYRAKKTAKYRATQVFDQLLTGHGRSGTTPPLT